MENINFKCFIQILFCGLSFGLDLEHDLKRLTHMLPGTYNSGKVAGETSQRHGDTAASQTSVVMNAVYMPVEVTFIPNAFNLYVEHTLPKTESPYRQWLYSFSVDEKSRAIRLKVYNFVKDAVKEKVRKNPSSLMYLNSNDVYTRSGCDMFWRRLGQLFVATTSKQCVAEVNDKQVRISVMTTLTPTTLQIDEGWYDIDDGTKIIELEGPVLLNKVSSYPDDRFLERLDSEPKPTDIDLPQKMAPSSLQKDGHVMRHGVQHKHHKPQNKEQPYPKPVNSYNYKMSLYGGHTSEKPYVKDTRISYSVIDKKDGTTLRNSRTKPTPPKSKYSRRNWTLRTYRAVVDALVTGHVVYFTAKTKRCKHVGTIPKERVTTGDYVDVFEIGKDYNLKEPHSYVTFSSNKVVHSELGFVTHARQVTVYRNGSIDIETVQTDEEDETQRYSITHCQLFSEDEPKGDVKFYLDPLKGVKTVKRFGSLRSALYKGKRIRTTIDISKCSGGKVTHVTVGAEIRNFDSVNNGRDIGFSLKQSRVNTPRSRKDLITRANVYTLVTVRKHGQAEVIVHSKHLDSFSRNHSVISGFVKYICDADTNSSTQAVSFYYV